MEGGREGGRRERRRDEGMDGGMMEGGREDHPLQSLTHTVHTTVLRDSCLLQQFQYGENDVIDVAEPRGLALFSMM